MTTPVLDATATQLPELLGWEPLQPFDGLPDFGFDRFYGVQCCDIGEDGEMMIVGHVGIYRAIAVFRARVRDLCGRGDALRFMRGLDSAENNVVHRWAVPQRHCATYPACGSLGPIAEPGTVCREDGEGPGFPAHDWGCWEPRPPALDVPDDRQYVASFRNCNRCCVTEVNLVNPAGHERRSNPCMNCREIDDCGGHYWAWADGPDGPDAFPVTFWLA